MSRFRCSVRSFASLAVVASILASAHSVSAQSIDLSPISTSAQVIDFETLAATQGVLGLDVNNDGINDVRFSATNPDGFGSVGPDPDAQLHVSGLVLETSSLSNPDIRVDFPGGAIDQLQVGFALLTDVNDVDQGLLLEVFDQAGNQMGSTFQRGELFPITTSLGSDISTFPEGRLSVSFEGVASYALLDATTTGTRFVIDDFTGTFLPAAVPEPGSLALVGFGGVILLGRRRKT